MRKAFYIFILVFAVQSAYSRPDSTARPFLPIVLSDTKEFFQDAGSFFTSPLHFSKDAWLTTGIILGGTATLFLADNSMQTLSLRNRATVLTDGFDITRIYGENYFGAGLSASIYGIGLFTKNKELRRTGLLVFESLAFSAAITHSLKVVVGRSRPYTGDDNTKFFPFSFQEEHWSLPSGHATAAFAISSVLSERLNNTYVSIGLYSLATLTAISRIYDDVHWTSDVALGAAIGYVSGKAVLQIDDEKPEPSEVSIIPTLNGIAIYVRF